MKKFIIEAKDMNEHTIKSTSTTPSSKPSVG